MWKYGPRMRIEDNCRVRRLRRATNASDARLHCVENAIQEPFLPPNPTTHPTFFALATS